MKAPKTGKAIRVKVGGVTVSIYHRIRKGTDYEQFQLADYLTGRRILRTFSNKAEAIREAERVARLLSRGEAAAARIQSADAAAYTRALQLIEPTGDAIEIAASRYAQAVNLLGNGQLLEAACRFYVERHPSTMPAITMEQAAAEMIELRRQGGASEPYLADLRCRTKSFIEAFKVHPASVTTADCQRWLDGLAGASSTKNATRRVIHRLFAHCESRGYIPRNSNPIAETQTYNGHRESAVVVWTPAEMAKLLLGATPDFLPCLAIGAFAGLRTSEILALDWRDVRLGERVIKVEHRKARCAGTRLAPITDNLAEWLTPMVKKHGPVWPHGTGWRERAKSLNDAQTATAQAAGLEWKHNALRHSFVTYRVASTQDVNKTSLEAGNSAKVVFGHYRALATKREGDAFFSIEPKKVKNILSLKTAAA